MAIIEGNEAIKSFGRTFFYWYNVAYFSLDVCDGRWRSVPNQRRRRWMK
jgi:hypothetical protein